MKKLRVMLLVHSTLVPPTDMEEWDDPRLDKYRTEFAVKDTLLDLGHEVKVVGAYGDLAPIRKCVDEWKPDIAFNLLEEFGGRVDCDFYVVGYLEMINMPYTGCNPRGMVLARDKALSKKLLSYHQIKVPEFHVFPFGRIPKRIPVLPYPMIVKSLIEEGSFGISQASYIENEQQLRERIALIHDKSQSAAIAEQYIHGREIYVTVMGNSRLQVFPFRELIFKNVPDDAPKMATYKVKWDDKYRTRWGIEYQFARNLPKGLTNKIIRLCKKIYRVLQLSGYARIDLRITPEGEIYVLEANPNPGIAFGEDCAWSAEKAGLEYEDFLEKIIALGFSASKPWKV